MVLTFIITYWEGRHKIKYVGKLVITITYIRFKVKNNISSLRYLILKYSGNIKINKLSFMISRTDEALLGNSLILTHSLILKQIMQLSLKHLWYNYFQTDPKQNKSVKYKLPKK